MILKPKFTTSKKRILVIAFIAVCGIIFALEATHVTSFIIKKPDSSKIDKFSDENSSKTTSKEPSAQSNFDDGDPRKEAGNTMHENRGSATIEETSGQLVQNNNPIASENGEITVYSPIKNSLVKTGAILSGTSKLSQIEFRIIDSVSGVIATGSLPVKDGRFSGKISFNTSATEGRIDIFATKADFTEYANIEIPIKFKD